MTGDTILEQLQADVAAVLAATPALSGAQVLSEDAGDIEKEILRKLGTLTEGPEGKRGLVLVVMLPEITAPEVNLPGPPVDITLEVQVIEQPVVNRDATAGTLIRSSVAAIRALASLHLRGLANAMLVAAPDAIRPIQVRPGFISHSVKLGVQYRGISPAGKVGTPNAAWLEDDTLKLATLTGSATIYYTTDGSYPTPANAEATEYTAAIALLAEGTVVRAAAYHATLAPSDLIEVTVVPEVSPGQVVWDGLGPNWEDL